MSSSPYRRVVLPCKEVPLAGAVVDSTNIQVGDAVERKDCGESVDWKGSTSAPDMVVESSVEQHRSAQPGVDQRMQEAAMLDEIDWMQSGDMEVWLRSQQIPLEKGSKSPSHSQHPALEAQRLEAKCEPSANPLHLPIEAFVSHVMKQDVPRGCVQIPPYDRDSYDCVEKRNESEVEQLGSQLSCGSARVAYVSLRPDEITGDASARDRPSTSNTQVIDPGRRCRLIAREAEEVHSIDSKQHSSLFAEYLPREGRSLNARSEFVSKRAQSLELDPRAGTDWHVEWSRAMGTDFDVKRVLNDYLVFDHRFVHSVSRAVDELNSGACTYHKNICFAYSKTFRQYFVLWKRGQEMEAVRVTRMKGGPTPTGRGMKEPRTEVRDSQTAATASECARWKSVPIAAPQIRSCDPSDRRANSMAVSIAAPQIRSCDPSDRRVNSMAASKTDSPDTTLPMKSGLLQSALTPSDNRFTSFSKSHMRSRSLEVLPARPSQSIPAWCGSGDGPLFSSDRLRMRTDVLSGAAGSISATPSFTSESRMPPAIARGSFELASGPVSTPIALSKYTHSRSQEAPSIARYEWRQKDALATWSMRPPLVSQLEPRTNRSLQLRDGQGQKPPTQEREFPLISRASVCSH